MNIHIKRTELFATLTLTNSAGRTFVTTLSRGIQKTDPKVRKMIRRFRRGKRVVDKTPPGKTGVGVDKSGQGVLL